MLLSVSMRFLKTKTELTAAAVALEMPLVRTCNWMKNQVRVLAVVVAQLEGAAESPWHP